MSAGGLTAHHSKGDSAMSDKRIELDVKITNNRGAWATLRHDPNGGIYCLGAWFAEAWVPDFPTDTPHENTSKRSRARAERVIRSG